MSLYVKAPLCTICNNPIINNDLRIKTKTHGIMHKLCAEITHPKLFMKDHERFQTSATRFYTRAMTSCL